MSPGAAERVDLPTVLALIEAVCGETDSEKLTGTTSQAADVA
jgi:hypothetical protein